MKILIICGTVAENARTKTLLKYLENLIIQLGLDVEFWDLKERPLVIAVPELHSDPLHTPDANTKAFVQAVKSANGFVLGSPLYHGSYTGVLKNALDNLYYDAFRNKAVALVSHSSNIRNCTVPSDHLRLVVRALFGYATQTQIGTTAEDYDDNPQGAKLINADIQARCKRLVLELTDFTRLLSSNSINHKI